MKTHTKSYFVSISIFLYLALKRTLSAPQKGIKLIVTSKKKNCTRKEKFEIDLFVWIEKRNEESERSDIKHEMTKFNFSLFFKFSFFVSSRCETTRSVRSWLSIWSVRVSCWAFTWYQSLMRKWKLSIEKFAIKVYRADDGIYSEAQNSESARMMINLIHYGRFHFHVPCLKSIIG